jgi:tetratricopeptide (TPR) repeat protein
MLWPDAMMRRDSVQKTTDSSISGERKPALDRKSLGYSRDVVLLSCLGLMLVFLAVTAFVSRMYHRNVHALADEWFRKGEAAFDAGRADEAVKDYRNALVYSPANSSFQLHLAQALIAEGRYDPARSYLLNLLAASPGSGEISLSLARIATHDPTSSEDALRYYYGAIYGVWDSDPLAKRWEVRRELCDYLFSRGMMNQAQAEIAALAQDVPPGDLNRRKQAAGLLMRVNLWNLALDSYRAILFAHKADPEALAGAATAELEMGQYARAIGYLEALPASQRKNPGISSTLGLAREAESVDPFLAPLPRGERARRAAAALALARARLGACSQNSLAANHTSLQQLQAVSNRNENAWTEFSLARNPALVGNAMEWVFQVEGSTAKSCGEPADLPNRALLLLSRAHPSQPS